MLSTVLLPKDNKVEFPPPSGYSAGTIVEVPDYPFCQELVFFIAIYTLSIIIIYLYTGDQQTKRHSISARGGL